MTTQKTSRQRKVYGLILALALGGLAVDRLILDDGATGPKSAKAMSGKSAPGKGGAALAAKADGAGLPPRSNTLAGRLDQVARDKRLDPLQVEDAFRISPTWVEPVAPTKPQAESESETEAFLKKHKLMALVNNAKGGAAIINNQTIVLGKTVDGFTLVVVTKRSAILEKDGQRVELTLPAPGGALLKAAD